MFIDLFLYLVKIKFLVGVIVMDVGMLLDRVLIDLRGEFFFILKSFMMLLFSYI